MEAKEQCRGCVHRDVCKYRERLFVDDPENSPQIIRMNCIHREIRI